MYSIVHTEVAQQPKHGEAITHDFEMALEAAAPTEDFYESHNTAFPSVPQLHIYI